TGDRRTTFWKRPNLTAPIELDRLFFLEAFLPCDGESDLSLVLLGIGSWVRLPLSPLTRQAPPCALQNEGLSQPVVASDSGQTLSRTELKPMHRSNSPHFEVLERASFLRGRIWRASNIRPHQFLIGERHRQQKIRPDVRHGRPEQCFLFIGIDVELPQ